MTFKESKMKPGSPGKLKAGNPKIEGWKFNIAPKKWWLEDDPFLLGQTVTFQGRTVKLREGSIFLYITYVHSLKLTPTVSKKIGLLKRKVVVFQGLWKVSFREAIAPPFRLCSKEN